MDSMMFLFSVLAVFFLECQDTNVYANWDTSFFFLVVLGIELKAPEHDSQVLCHWDTSTAPILSVIVFIDENTLLLYLNNPQD